MKVVWDSGILEWANLTLCSYIYSCDCISGLFIYYICKVLIKRLLE